MFYDVAHHEVQTSVEGRTPSRPYSPMASRSLTRTTRWHMVQAPVLRTAASARVLGAHQNTPGSSSVGGASVRHETRPTSVRLRRHTGVHGSGGRGTYRHLVLIRWTDPLHRSDSIAMGSPASRERQPALAPVASATRSQSYPGREKQEELGGFTSPTCEPGLRNQGSPLVSTRVVRGKVMGHRRENTPSPVADTHPSETCRAHDLASPLSSVLRMNP
jgi:hypothetical protein